MVLIQWRSHVAIPSPPNFMSHGWLNFTLVFLSTMLPSPFAVKDFGRRTGHVNMIIRLVPMDGQISSQQMDFHPALGEASQDTCNAHSAGTCSASKGFAGPSLPGSLVKLIWRNHLYKFDIHAGREMFILFDERSDFMDPFVCSLINKYHAVRIPH